MTTRQDSPEETTEDIAAHSSVGLLIQKVDKAIKRNAAMPVGELWQYHLKALLLELHKFHIDYADDAADAAADEAGVDPDYVNALAEFLQEGKDLIVTQTALLVGAFAQLGYLDGGVPVKEKMPVDVQPVFSQVQQRLASWMARYPELVEEQAATEVDAPPVEVIPPAPGATP